MLGRRRILRDNYDERDDHRRNAWSWGCTSGCAVWISPFFMLLVATSSIQASPAATSQTTMHNMANPFSRLCDDACKFRPVSTSVKSTSKDFVRLCNFYSTADLGTTR